MGVILLFNQSINRYLRCRKLGERNNRRQNKIFHSPGEYFSFLKDGNNEILDIVVLSDFKVRSIEKKEGKKIVQVVVVYKTVNEALESISTTSKASAALTTAYARVRLYRAMKRINPESLLYCGERRFLFLFSPINRY